MGRFSKMHGLGNDFVVIDARTGALDMTESRARAIADRHAGIGCDQLILIGNAPDADVSMQIFNADGSEVEACGNATRCVPLFVGRDVLIRTRAGLLDAKAVTGGASVDMGAPRFDWDAIPLAYAMDTLTMSASWEDLPPPAAVNVGNPHVIFFVEDLDAVDTARLGPIIETDPLFPSRVNVNFAQVVGDNHLRLIVWERGAGLTRACGTGACATAVAAIRRKLVGGPVTVSLPGGDLVIDWAPGGTIRMTGPATHVFDGEADWSRF
ncbi:MAG: diaminopimelate epimerase [Pseudomonadota bacterium]|uniref:Diaminopimelate epimerase n=1 Tax=Sphingobium xenophagum TaxID=121428 RepID=A0A249MTB4_SPHXE|nr:MULTISPECIES: diaminopimelate epimerase [Sphingobium]ASY44603.1 diaminopimelate epimerase [Sphingobium xenophagum]OUC53767.1 diaminopimelate epimerase [Sphingobium sp. GW456-12-10-14-TSB1]QWT15044.1 diaminopimelate epimerase [Sphingobium xenophagum]|tara:strand:- start:5826 stop:6626 length:801 start_codon:yes stop_codon:yes gene_type:complete